MESSGLILVVVFAVALVSALWLAAAMRIVPEHSRIVVFRLGRCLGVYGPGLSLLLPFIDRSVSVDLREQVRTFASDAIDTQDHVRLSIELTWSYKVNDPVQSVLGVADLGAALQATALTALRAIIGGQPFSDVLHARQRVRDELHGRLRAATGNWGVEITNVEFRDIRRSQ